MTHEDYLRVLGATIYSSLDEIKVFYHALIKIHHPDVDKSDGTKLARINEAYAYLKKNHIPKRALAGGNVDRFYRILNDTRDYHRVGLPTDVLPNDTIIFCRIRDREFTVRFGKGEHLPIKIEIRNIGPKFIMEFFQESPRL